MIATITAQSHRMDKDQNRFSNMAGGPLPIIPRRASTSRPTLTPSVSMPLPVKTSLSSFASSSSSMLITTTPATPPKNDSDSSSSSSPSSDGTRPTIRTRRSRGTRNNAVSSTEWPTYVPALAATQKIVVASPTQKDNTAASTSQTSPASPSRPLLYTPGMSLRLCVDSIKGHKASVSESHVSHSAGLSTQTSQSTSALYDTPLPERIVRKKSGQLVKPSLKTSRSNSLSVYTLPLSSKSEPTTPTSKAVHFDTNLEQVKLFLAEQKPLAVSRDGSPTDDTSGTESDFPTFIFGADGTVGAGEDKDSSSRRPKKKLLMQVANMPVRINPDSDVALEEMSLSPEGTSILGKVRVRNIAFAKWVAVRFTFDAWQTTSEVTGRYVESVEGGFDRFAFSIRLNDLLATIEGKTLVVAVKYAVEGKEMWDNNNGQNYVATFTKTKLPKEDLPQPHPSSPTKKAAFLSSDEETDMAHLKTKLEKVVQGKDRTGSSSGSNFRRSPQPPPPASADPDITSFRSTASFASRYDFSSSFKSAWNPAKGLPSASPASLHTRTQSFPLSSTKSGNSGSFGSVPWPQKSPSDPYALRRQAAPIPIVSPPSQSKRGLLGSPRDLGEESYASNALRSPLELEDAPFPVQQPAPAHSNSHSRSARNHQRGYFDISFSSGTSALKRTPPGTPRSPGEEMYLGSPHRYNSFPTMETTSSGPSSSSSSSSSFSSFTSAALSSSFLKDVTPRQMRSQSQSQRSASVSPGPAVPILREEEVTGLNVQTGEESELSTPSMSTPSSSRESSPSPTELFMSMVDEENAMSPETHYRQFLNKFCFFTGPGSTISDSPSYAYSTTSSTISTSSSTSNYSDESMYIPRTHSASEIEELLSGISPRLQAIANGTASALGGAGASPMQVLSPPRSPSFDDLMLGGLGSMGSGSSLGSGGSSGSLTPTVSRLSFAGMGGSQQGTPVLA